MFSITRPSCRKTVLNIGVFYIAITGFTISNIAASELYLSLSETEQLALETDVLSQSFTATAQALNLQSVADGQLSDPKLKVAAMNFPTDSFARGQEPMTQLQLGIQQTFPRGRTLEHSSDRTSALAKVETARAVEQRLSVLRMTRKIYLDLYFQLQSERILSKHEQLFTKLLDITQRQYAVGRDNQHDVLRAQLELSLLQDKLTEIAGLKDIAVVELAKWITYEHATRPLPGNMPVLPAIPTLSTITEKLPHHPLIIAQDHLVDAKRHEVAIAKEQYKPGWMIDVSYGGRTGRNLDGSERTDFLSAMVLLDMPLFTGKRQDKRVSASQKQHLASKFARTDKLRDLTGQAGSMYARWTRLGERFSLYQSRTLIEATQNAEATLKAYQSDVTDFTSLMRARLTELNTQLAMTRLEVERAKIQADLLYFAGESL